MEHRILQGGGEQYLPFARSRVKALRATGLKYVVQKYAMPDGNVEVHILGNHEYIWLKGKGQTLFISGVTRIGSIVDSKLHEFHVDAGTWRTLFKQKPELNPYPDDGTTYWYDEAYLAVSDQYVNVPASMYSGLMAKAAQAAMGYIKDGETAVELQYNYRWACTHGVVKDSTNKFWLVEISSTNGVIATPLPVDKIQTAQGKDYNLDLVRNLFGGGIPNGVAFPADIPAAIAAGSVVRWAEASALSDYFSKSAYSDTLGWSFNENGSEAHNTCYDTDGTNYTGYHYKLDFDPLNGTATLTEVSSGDLHGVNRFMFWDGDAQIFRKTPTRAWAGGSLPAEEQQTTIFVFHKNNTLERVYHYSVNGRAAYTQWNPGIKWFNSSASRAPVSMVEHPDYFTWTETHGAVNKESYVTSDSILGFAAGTFDRTDVLDHSVVGTFELIATPGVTYTAYYQSLERVYGTLYSSRGVWPDGTRDGVVIRDYGGAGLTQELGSGSHMVLHTAPPYTGDYGIEGIDLTYVSPSTVTLPDGTTGYLYGRSNFDKPESAGGLAGVDGSLSITNSELEKIRVIHALDREVVFYPEFADATEHNTNNDLWNNTSSIFNARSSVIDEQFNYCSSIKIDSVDDVYVGAISAFYDDVDGMYESSRICFVGATTDNWYA